MTRVCSYHYFILVFLIFRANDVSVGTINLLHESLPVPVAAKFRIFPSTVAYTKMLESAGAQILACAHNADKH